MRRQEAEPASDEIVEVAPGVLRLQLPVPLPGLKHVNCYAAEDERGWTVVDPGMPGPFHWRALRRRVHAAGFRIRDIHTVVVTHSHPDHFGAATRLRQVAGADVVTASNFGEWWDAARLRRRFLAAPTPTRQLADAQTIGLGGRDWLALHTPGHTPDHVCLYDPEHGALLSGDHVLPTITPHVSGAGAGDGNDPLGSYVTSLIRVSDLENISVVLPAHGHPFTDLAGRVTAIRSHHEERLDQLRKHLADLGEATVDDLTRRLFKPKAWGRLAQSETYAHLEHLRIAGEITRQDRARAPLYSLR